MLKINERVAELLNQLGLSKTEQQLYLIGLTKPSVTVSELIDTTGVNRTTAYHALGTLKQKGFVTEARLQGKLIYNMTPPVDIEAYLDRRYAALDNQRQQLKDIANLFPKYITNQTRTVVEKFEGIEGVKEAIDRALYCKRSEWRIIAPRDNFFSQMGAGYADYFIMTRRAHGIKARSLWEPAEKEAKLGLDIIFERHPHYLPKELAGQFKSVIIIYDDKALFISSTQNPNAVIVCSKELVGALIVMFDGLWSLSQKPTSPKRG